MRETPREYLDRESRYVWGTRVMLRVEEVDAVPSVDLGPSRLNLRIRPGAGTEARRRVVESWYRQELRDKARHVWSTSSAIGHSSPTAGPSFPV